MNPWGERWSKLVINAMRNCVSAATGMSGNERDLNDMTRWLSIRLGRQAVRVGQAHGFQLEKMLGMKPETLARAGEESKDALAEITEILTTLAKNRSDEQRPSMAQDMLKGRRTEIDALNGFVAEKGAELGMQLPLHVAMRELVRNIERGEIEPGVDTVAHL